MYDPDSSLNKLKRDKDGIAKDYPHVLTNIWEYVTSDWQVQCTTTIITIKGVKTYYQVFSEEEPAGEHS